MALASRLSSLSPVEQQARVHAFERQHLPSPLHALKVAPFAELAKQAGVCLSIKRDDLIHPKISGNKWRKLSGNAQAIIAQHISTVISFGGAYSNHLVALAALMSLLRIRLVAIIRGEAPPQSQWNPRLRYLAALGVELHFVDRATYRQRYDPAYQAVWRQRYPESIVIPEGGSNVHALSGIGNMVAEVRQQVVEQHLPPITHWLCPIGSGGTTAGLCAHREPGEQVVAVSVLKGADDLSVRVEQVYAQYADECSDTPDIPDQASLAIWHDYHAGGYARSTPGLLQLVATLNAAGLPTEPVYTGKMFLALREQLVNSYFPPGSHVVVIHTGGVWSDE